MTCLISTSAFEDFCVLPQALKLPTVQLLATCRACPRWRATRIYARAKNSSKRIARAFYYVKSFPIRKSRFNPEWNGNFPHYDEPRWRLWHHSFSLQLTCSNFCDIKAKSGFFTRSNSLRTRHHFSNVLGFTHIIRGEHWYCNTVLG